MSNDMRAMTMYLLALAIGFATIMAFWKLWAIPQLMEVADVLQGVSP